MNIKNSFELEVGSLERKINQFVLDKILNEFFLTNFHINSN